MRKSEDVIEKIARVFAGFADKVLQSDAAKADSSLTQELRDSMQVVVRLANGLVDSDLSQESAQAAAARHAPSPKNVSDVPADDQKLAPAPVESVQSANADDNEPRRDYPVFMSNVFGNGWTRDLPYSYTASLAMGTIHQLPADSMGLKAVHFTLQRAYRCLLDAVDLSAGLAGRMFRFSLKQHTREELLFNIRWFLGPGNPHLHRLAGAPFEQLFNQFSPQLTTLAHGVNLTGPRTVSAPLPGLFLNANEVEAYLTARGACRVDDNTLELSVESDTTNFTPLPNFGRSPSPFNLGLFSASPHRTGQVEAGKAEPSGSTRIRISQTLFLYYLSDISLCVSYGPGYRRDLLEYALIASSVHRPRNLATGR